MANIKVDLPIPIYDGMPVTFKAPVDCSEITGLRVYYPETETSTTSQDFTLVDANRNDVGNINNLFTANAIVKVILDTDEHMAFIQNADTNAYLEGRFGDCLPLTTTAEDIGAAAANHTHTAADVGAVAKTGDTMTGNLTVEKSAPYVYLKNSSTGRTLSVYMAGDNTAAFANRKDNNNYNGLYLTPETSSRDRILRLMRRVDGGTAEYYNVYGEHNITKSTTDLTAGTSALTTGTIYLVYE